MAAARSGNLNFRISPQDQALIRRAADACGKSVTSFVQEAAIDRAQSVLLEQRFLRVPADVFDNVADMVAEPARPHPKLVDLFRTPPVWGE
jgi:uncharacterized protein (DUF1778 family)